MLISSPEPLNLMVMSWINTIWKKSGALASSQKKQRQFAVLLGSLLVVILILNFWKEHQLNYWLFAVLVIALLIAVIIPALLKLPLQIWFVFGSVLGEVMSTLILGIIYYLLFVPINLLRKDKNEPGWQKINETDTDYEKLY